jgi:hypothetical protein
VTSTPYGVLEKNHGSHDTASKGHFSFKVVAEPFIHDHLVGQGLLVALLLRSTYVADAGEPVTDPCELQQR